jgi:hypothetical protein
MIDSNSADFFVLAHERGHEVDALPLWASARPDLVQFDDAPVSLPHSVRHMANLN